MRNPRSTQKNCPDLERLRARRVEILEVAKAHGAHNVRVFGSVARGEARPDSDVDLLVEFEPGRSLVDEVELRLDLERLLGVRVEVTEDVHHAIRQKVAKEAVAL